jgi:glycosyltransferase involved in cell wall biosynthesis
MKLKIGILGTRGIPNAYGGFEQCAQELSARLAKKGHEVSVYNSSLHPYRGNEFEGVKIIRCKGLEGRLGTVGQFFYDLNCIRDSGKRGFDILLQLGYTSNSVWHRRWPPDAVNIINMDGLEWKRSKYSKPVQWFLKKAEAWAAKYGDILIADSPGIRDHISKEYKKTSEYIAYGAEIFQNANEEKIRSFGIHPKQYYLLIARMEPENNVEMILDGYVRSGNRLPFIVIGNPGNAYGKRLLTKYAGKNIRFVGAIYDAGILNNLRYFSSVYFHGHSVGGTNPSLLEAMACSCDIAAHENIFNRSVLGNDAMFFNDKESVNGILQLPEDPEYSKRKTAANLQKIREQFSWQYITDRYEEVMLSGFAAKAQRK